MNRPSTAISEKIRAATTRSEVFLKRVKNFSLPLPNRVTVGVQNCPWKETLVHRVERAARPCQAKALPLANDLLVSIPLHEPHFVICRCGEMYEVVGGEDIGGSVVIECHLEGFSVIWTIDYLHYLPDLVTEGKAVILAQTLSRRVGRRA